MLMDFDPGVRAVSSQPFWLRWRDGRERSRRHAPDYFARRDDGRGVVVDVRPDDRIPDRDAETFAVTAAACQAAGWEYRRAGDLDPVLAANVRWLSRYRHRRCLVPEIRRGAAGGLRRRAGPVGGGGAGRGPAAGAAGAVPPDVARQLTAGLAAGALARRLSCARVGHGEALPGRCRRPCPGRRRAARRDRVSRARGCGWPMRPAAVRTVTVTGLLAMRGSRSRRRPRRVCRGGRSGWRACPRRWWRRRRGGSDTSPRSSMGCRRTRRPGRGRSRSTTRNVTA